MRALLCALRGTRSPAAPRWGLRPGTCWAAGCPRLGRRWGRTGHHRGRGCVRHIPMSRRRRGTRQHLWASSRSVTAANGPTPDRDRGNLDPGQRRPWVRQDAGTAAKRWAARSTRCGAVRARCSGVSPESRAAGALSQVHSVQPVTPAVRSASRIGASSGRGSPLSSSWYPGSRVRPLWDTVNRAWASRRRDSQVLVVDSFASPRRSRSEACVKTGVSSKVSRWVARRCAWDRLAASNQRALPKADHVALHGEGSPPSRRRFVDATATATVDRRYLRRSDQLMRATSRRRGHAPRSGIVAYRLKLQAGNTSATGGGLEVPTQNVATAPRISVVKWIVRTASIGPNVQKSLPVRTKHR